MKELRTREQVDAEYTQHAAQAGHKTSLVTEREKEIEALQTDVQAHLVRMAELRREVVASSPQSALAVAPEAPANAKRGKKTA